MEILKNMHLFVEVAKASSFRRAGEVLDLPSSTVSRRIAELERDVGVRLFHRTTRRVELTEAGQRYFENCKRIVKEAELAHQQLVDMQEKPSGLIRASLPVDFSVMYLPRLLADFAKRYPDIQFDFSLTPVQADLMADSIDLVIRMAAPKEQNVIARNIANLSTGLYASPDYLANREHPKRPEDLLTHDCLRIRDTPWKLHSVIGDKTCTVAVDGQFVANNIGFLRAMALNGQGIVTLAEVMAEPDISQNKLVKVLPDWSPPTVPIYVLTVTRLLPAKVRAFVDYLVEHLTQLSGTQTLVKH